MTRQRVHHSCVLFSAVASLALVFACAAPTWGDAPRSSPSTASTNDPPSVADHVVPETPAVLLFGLGGWIMRWQFRRRRERLATPVEPVTY